MGLARCIGNRKAQTIESACGALAGSADLCTESYYLDLQEICTGALYRRQFKVCFHAYEIGLRLACITFDTVQRPGSSLFRNLDSTPLHS